VSRSEEIYNFVADVVNENDFPMTGDARLVNWVNSYKDAFRQFIMEVILVQSISADTWLADEFRINQGWVKAVETGYNYYRSLNDE